jgi:hypothetical protein
MSTTPGGDWQKLASVLFYGTATRASEFNVACRRVHAAGDAGDEEAMRAARRMLKRVKISEWRLKQTRRQL